MALAPSVFATEHQKVTYETERLSFPPTDKLIDYGFEVKFSSPQNLGHIKRILFSQITAAQPESIIKGHVNRTAEQTSPSKKARANCDQELQTPGLFSRNASGLLWDWN